MQKHTVQFQREQIKREAERKKQEEINKICQDIPDFKEKIEKEKKLLSLMLAIKKVSEKEGKTPEEINSLNEMIAMYEEQKIILAQFENTIKSVSNKGIIDEPVAAPAILTPDQTFHAEETSLFLQQLQKVALKKVEQNTDKNTLASPENTGSASTTFLLDLINALSENKLKQVNRVNTVASEASAETKSNQSELQRKLAERRVLLEETVTTSEENSSESDEDSKQIIPVLDEALSPVTSNEGSGSDSEKDVDEFDFLEKIFNTSGFQGDGVPDIFRFKNALSIIYEDKTRPNSTMDELDALLKSLNEQLSTLDNEIKKPQSPLSMYFNSARENKSVIVEAILKPKI